MGGNTFGKHFKIATFGESHGPAIGVIIDGCPAGLEINRDYIQSELDRRRPGQSKLTTQRKEDDKVQILSGVYENKSTGTPIMILINNKDSRSKDYDHLKSAFRPSHADFTYQQKYDIRDHRGGGRSSARETVARVAAGAVAKLMLKQFNIEIKGYVSSVGDLTLDKIYSIEELSGKKENEIRCPDEAISKAMIALIEEVKKQGDTVGGVVSCVINNCPVGIGEPVFDKLHADLGKAMLSINACKGFEYGSGFNGTKLRGSEHNDIFESVGEKVITTTNNSGGIQGGISNGMDIYFKVAFKPVATIMKDQKSISSDFDPVNVKGKGRHDPCVVPRAVPIVEAMAALVIADQLLRSKTNKISDLSGAKL